MRAEFLGIPIDLLTHDQTVGRAVGAMLTRKTTHHVGMNVAKLVKTRKDPDLRRDISESDIVSVNGMGIVWGARALGIKVPERVTDADLMESLLGICAAHDFRPYVLGARYHVLQKALINALHRWPGLRLAGYHDEYFNRDDERQIVDEIRASRAHCLFIAMPTPRKESFLHQYRDALDVPFIMGVGNALEILAGYVKRAPRGVQTSGLEWLYRSCREPRRLGWRHVSSNAVFAAMLGRELVVRAIRGDRVRRAGGKYRL
jgi:N-acetylglucosaminyldiphosphoundecaprenol N-acetyl-beta-D-mannosaminyltransferase